VRQEVGVDVTTFKLTANDMVAKIMSVSKRRLNRVKPDPLTLKQSVAAQTRWQSARQSISRGIKADKTAMEMAMEASAMRRLAQRKLEKRSQNGNRTPKRVLSGGSGGEQGGGDSDAEEGSMDEGSCTDEDEDLEVNHNRLLYLISLYNTQQVGPEDKNADQDGGGWCTLNPKP
jgi:hypothetical protein